jgi:hypothetical protein
MNLIAHHQCFKNKRATEFAISEFRKHNPNVPYVLWSDAGEDYTEISGRLGVDYFHSDLNVGYKYYDKEGAFELYNRIRKSCELYPEAKNVLWMEDDVLVKGEVLVPSGCDFSGIPDVGNRFYGITFGYLCEKYGIAPNFDFYSTAGGTLMCADTFRDKFNVIERFIEEDYEFITNEICREMAHHDVMIMLAHLITNKRYGVNPCLTEVARNSNWPDPRFTIVHGYKNAY